MSPCVRFEQEGLARLERGLPLDEHFESCPECIAARESHARLCEMLRDSGPREEPREGWEARVRSIIAQPAPARRKWGWWVASAAAVISVAILSARFLQTPVEAPWLQHEIGRGDRSERRGDTPHPGDRLILRGQTGGASYAELRVYRDDTELVLHCSDAPPCVLRGTRLSATLALEHLGVFQPVLITSEQPIPPPGGTLDEDAATLLSREASVLLTEEIRVR